MKLSATAILVMLAQALPAQKPNPSLQQFFPVDKGHSYVEFSVKYMGAAKVKGRFADFSGLIYYDENDVTRTSVSFLIKSASINTDLEFRDNDLKSDNWLSATKFPSLLFQSKKVSKTMSGIDVTGDLTMKGVMKEITLHMESPTSVTKDIRGDLQVVFVGTTQLDRTAFGVEGKNWSALKEGITAVNNEVSIEVSILGKQFQKSNFANWVRDENRPAAKIYKTVRDQGVDAGIAEFNNLNSASTLESGVLDTVGKMLRLEGKTAEAAKLFELNRKTFPEDIRTYQSLGETYLLTNDIPKAKEQFSEILKRDIQQPAALEYMRHLN